HSARVSARRLRRDPRRGPGPARLPRALRCLRGGGSRDQCRAAFGRPGLGPRSQGPGRPYPSRHPRRRRTDALMASNSRRRVLVDAPPYPLAKVRELLAGNNVTVEAPPRPWAGDDVVGLLVDRPVTTADFDRLPAL